MTGKELVERIIHTQPGLIGLTASMAQYTGRQHEYLVELSLSLTEDTHGVLGDRLGDVVPLLAEYINSEEAAEHVARFTQTIALTPELLTQRFTDGTTGLIQFAANRAEETGTQLAFLEAMRDQYLPEQDRMREKIGPELCADLAAFFNIPNANA